MKQKVVGAVLLLGLVSASALQAGEAISDTPDVLKARAGKGTGRLAEEGTEGGIEA